MSSNISIGDEQHFKFNLSTQLQTVISLISMYDTQQNTLLSMFYTEQNTIIFYFNDKQQNKMQINLLSISVKQNKTFLLLMVKKRELIR